MPAGVGGASNRAVARNCSMCSRTSALRLRRRSRCSAGAGAAALCSSRPIVACTSGGTQPKPTCTRRTKMSAKSAQAASRSMVCQAFWREEAFGKSWRNELTLNRVASVVASSRAGSNSPLGPPSGLVAASWTSSGSLVVRSRNSSLYGTLTPLRSGAWPGPGLSVRK